MRRILRAAAAAALAAALGGCTLTSLQQSYQNDPNAGYVQGQTGITVVQPDQRKAPVEFSGTTESGAPFDSKSELGKVVVVNFWYVLCPPCRVEASDLAAVAAEYAKKGVVVIGINTRDDASSITAYDEQFGVKYPSIVDAASGAAQLAFSGAYRPNATPTTIILDREGRIAARIEATVHGQLSNLTSLIDSALAEKTL
jgi:thiol-disulfide isomerase/thioredoxin